MQGDRRGLIAALVAAGIAICAPGPAQAAEQQAHAQAFTFTTPVVTITQGDTLRFNNDDAIAKHNIASDTAGQFTSALIDPGKNELVDGVDKLAPGSYQFHCDLHAWMRGVLDVQAPGSSGPPSVDPNNPPNPVDLLPHAAPAPLTAGEWPFYGHDLANTRNGGASGPAAIDVPFLKPVWSLKAPGGDFVGTPVVSGGTLVAVAGDGTVYALDASTGRVLWTRDVATDPDEVADATAAIADGQVFVPVARAGNGTDKGPEIQALSLADGTPPWRTPYDTQRGADDFGSPVVWEGRFYIGTSGQNGDPDLPMRGNVTALDENTGEQLWKAYLVPPGANGAPVWSTPAIDTATGILYAGTGNAYSGVAADTTDAIVAIDARTGELLGHMQGTAGDVFTTTSGGAFGPDYDFGSSPNLIDGPNGQKLVGEGAKSGTYWAVDRATMKPVWSFTTGPGSPLGGILGSTAYDGTHVYGPDTPGGENWALALDGTPAWVSSDGGPLHWNSTSVANGVVYTADQSQVLTAREAATGAVLAKVPIGASSYGGVAIAGGYVFVAVGTQSSSGYVVAYRADPPPMSAGSGRRAAGSRRSPRAALPGGAGTPPPACPPPPRFSPSRGG